MKLPNLDSPPKAGCVDHPPLRTDSMERAGTDETGRLLHQTVGLVVVIGAGFLGWSVWNLVRTGTWAQPPSWLWLGCFAVMLTLANTLVLEVRIKSSQHQMMM